MFSSLSQNNGACDHKRSRLKVAHIAAKPVVQKNPKKQKTLKTPAVVLFDTLHEDSDDETEATYELSYVQPASDGKTAAVQFVGNGAVCYGWNVSLLRPHRSANVCDVDVGDVVELRVMPWAGWFEAKCTSKTDKTAIFAWTKYPHDSPAVVNLEQLPEVARSVESN